MPVEFVHDAKDPKDAYKLLMAYDGSGRRISKTRYSKNVQYGYWTQDVVTHYTGIGTEVRESYFGGALENAKVVVNMPQGLGRYQPEDAVDGLNGVSGSQLAGYRPPAKFEWYLKNHLGSTMLVYGTSAYSDPFNSGYKGGVKAAYDYRAFGEQVDLAMPTDKVTENFTGKEKDDETELNYFGARYLDPMLGLWISVDAARQYQNPYLYAGNNPVMRTDPDGNADALGVVSATGHTALAVGAIFGGIEMCQTVIGCALGGPLVVGGVVDLAKAPYNFFIDHKDQTWPSDEIMRKMPEGVQDAFRMIDNISNVKSIAEKDVAPFAIDFFVDKIDNVETPIPLMDNNINGPTPSDNTNVYSREY